MIGLVRRGRRGAEGDEGYVLVLAIGTMMLVTTLLLLAIGVVVSNTAASRTLQDSRASTAAAQAGITDYVGRLNVDPNYWTGLNSDSTNAAMTAAGRTLPGLTARYTYRVLNSVVDIRNTGTIQLEVTGYSAGGTRAVNRVLRAALTTSGFVSYAYFSDYEVADPSQFSSSNAKCSNYYWTATTGRATINSGNPSNTCPEQPWLTGDVVNGPIHTNDFPYVTGAPTLTGTTVDTGATSTSTGKYYWGSGSPSTAPTSGSTRAMPTSGTSLIQYVSPRPNGATGGPGCLYKGATRITFSGTTMQVYSPGSAGIATSACLNSSNPSAALAIPPLIYVQSTSACSAPSLGFPATNEFTGATYQDSAGGTAHSPNYDCAQGNAYVSGTVSSSITVATENDVVVTGDLTVPDHTGSAMVGLISGGNTWIYHPVRETATQTGSTPYCVSYFLGLCTSTKYAPVYSYAYSNLLTTPVRTVEASILSLDHSFLVQNADRGAALSTAVTASSKLTVYGSVTQKYRGQMATSSSGTISSGYLVNYQRDPRLSAQSPPYFPTPSRAPWRVASITDG